MIRRMLSVYVMCGVLRSTCSVRRRRCRRWLMTRMLVCLLTIRRCRISVVSVITVVVVGLTLTMLRMSMVTILRC